MITVDVNGVGIYDKNDDLHVQSFDKAVKALNICFEKDQSVPYNDEQIRYFCERFCDQVGSVTNGTDSSMIASIDVRAKFGIETSISPHVAHKISNTFMIMFLTWKICHYDQKQDDPAVLATTLAEVYQAAKSKSTASLTKINLNKVPVSVND